MRMRPYDIGLAERQIEAYGREVDRWRHEHDAAMKCRDFELLLKLGLDVYETLRRIDAEISAAVFRGERVQADLEFVDLVYRLWLAPSAEVERRLEEFERSGFRVEFAAEYRSAGREVRGLLTPDDEFFRGEALADLRDDAIDAYRRGRTEDLIESDEPRGQDD